MHLVASDRLTDRDFQRLLAFRTEIRRFLRWSEEQATAEGITPAQHQLLLAVRGHPARQGPTIGDVADALLLRHHSAVGLVDRTVDAGLLRRVPDVDDHRRVRLRLTPRGDRILTRMSRRHLEELERLERGVLSGDAGRAARRRSRPGEEAGEEAGQEAMGEIRVRRVYEPPAADDGYRVLVDRIWPRGVAKDRAHLDEWCKTVGPSPELRRWYGHDPAKYDEFAHRYRAELEEPERAEALEHLRAVAARATVTLLTASRRAEISQAAVLARVLADH